MANQFVARKGLVAKADSNITGSLVISGSNNGLRIKQGKLSLDQPVDISFANGQIIDDNGSGGLRIYTPTYSTDIYSGKSGTLKFFTSGSVERVRLDAAGNMGIGTNSPSTTLHVAGNTAIHTAGTYAGANGDPFTIQDPLPAIRLIDSQATSRVARISAENGALHFESDINSAESNNDIRFSLDGTERLRILNSGRVGIGTATPNRELDVHGSIALQNPSYYSGSYDWMFSQDSSNGRLAISYYGAEKVSIKDDGKVGIGVTAPVKELHVTGSGRFTGYGRNLDLTDGANVVGSNHVVLKAGASYAQVQSDNNNIYLRTGAGVVVQNGTGVEQMRFTPTGRIGIGLTNPDAPLHISQSSTSGVKFSRVNHDDIDLSLEGSNRFVISNTTDGLDLMALMYDTGRVGIGTNAPTDTLTINQKADGSGIHINGYDDKVNSYAELYVDSQGNTRLTQANSGSSGYLQLVAENYLELTAPGLVYTTSNFRIYDAGVLSIGSHGDYKIKYVDGSNILNIHTDDNKGLTIDNVGKLGVGLTSPSYQLHVSAGTTNEVARFESTDGTSMISFKDSNKTGYVGLTNTRMSFGYAGNLGASNLNIISGSGNVGIGTTNPATKLTVAGAISASSGFYGDGSNLTGVTTSDTLDSILARGNEAQGTAIIMGSGDIQDAGEVSAVTLTGTTGSFSYVTASADLHIDTKVGIGTATPQVELHVEGRTRMTYGGNTAFYAGNYVRVFDSQAYQFRNSGGSSIAQINLSGDSYFNGGNVGIGTASPSQKLDVEGNIQVGDSHFIGNETTYDNLLLQSSTGESINLSSAESIFLKTGGTGPGATGTTRLFVSSSGNVGIGTTNPIYKLQVAGNISASGAVYSDTYAGTTYSANSFLRFNDDQTLQTNMTTLASIARINFMADTNNNDGASARMFTWYANTADVDTATELMYLNKDGALNLDGDLTVTGIVTAQEFHTEFVSASIMYESGSTKFGDTGDDRHDFTGSLGVSGSIDVDSTGAYKIGGTTILDASSTYTRLKNPEGSNTLYLGDSGDRRNYYDNNSHRFRGAGGSGDYAYLDSTGLGVGTTNPVTSLHVEGEGATASGNKYQFILSDNTAYGINKGGGLIFRGDYNSATSQSNFAAIRSGKANANDGNANAYLAFLYGASGTLTEGMRIDYNGKIGIGTTSPSEKLEVIGTIKQKTGAAYSNYVQQSVSEAQLEFSTYSVNQSAYPSAIKFSPNGTEAVRIHNNGRVGIGTTAPAAELHVSGTGFFSGTTADDTAVLKLGQLTGASTEPLVTVYADDDGADKLEFYTGRYGAVTAFTHASASSSDRIDSVLIGGSYLYGGSIKMYGKGGLGGIKTQIGTEDFTYFNGGNVGIGTSSPTKKLTVNGDTWISSSGATLTVGDANTGGTLKFGTPSNNTKITYASSEMGIYTAQSKGINFYTNGSSRRMVIQDNGNIGFGVDSPSGSYQFRGTKFDPAYNSYNGVLIDSSQVSHAVDAYGVGIEFTALSKVIKKAAIVPVGCETDNDTTGLAFLVSSGSSQGLDVMEGMRIAARGNVGIGTTSPQAKLHVEGAISASGDLTTGGQNFYLRSGTSVTRFRSLSYLGLFSSGGGAKPIKTGKHTISSDYNDDAPTNGLYVKGNISGSGAINVSGAVTASYFKGDGSGLTGVTATIPLNEVLGTGNDGGGADMDNIGTISATALNAEAQVSSSYLYFDHGTNTAPGLAFGNDTNTGIFGNNDSTVRFTINGGEKVRINQHGLGMLSTTVYLTSQYKINFDYGVTNDYFVRKNNSNLEVYSAGNVAIGANSATKLFVSQSGNVGVGTTVPISKLDVAGDARATNFQVDSGNRYKIGNNSQYITGTNDTAVEVYSGGSSRLYVSSSGQIGIGTSSPYVKLHVNGDARVNNLMAGNSAAGNTPAADIHIKSSGTDAKLRIEDSDSDNLYYDFLVNSGSGFSLLEGTTTRIFAQDTTGNVGIGDTSPSAKLTVRGDADNGNVGVIEVKAGSSNLKIGGTDTYSYIQSHNSQELRINMLGNDTIINPDGGSVGIGTSSPSHKLDVNGEVGATSFIETSARRFKENIEPISNALDIVSTIDGVTFNRIGEERREYGFIADEIESTAPELVSYDANGEVHGVHYARTVAILTEAVKELDNKVKAQDLFIKDLVARIEKLENK